jgi:hypothetical protein
MHPDENPPTNLIRAVRHHRNSLDVLSRETQPDVWANASYESGLTLLALAETGVAEHLDEAIRCFEGALEIFTRDSYPTEHFPAAEALTKARSLLTDS